MRRKSANVWTGGVISGVVITATAWLWPRLPATDRMMLLVAMNILPTLTCTLLGVHLLRGWLEKHTAQTQQEHATAAAERNRFAGEMTKRMAEIAQREKALNAASTDSEARMSKLLALLLEEREARAKLQQEHDEVTEDYNRVVSDSLQQYADTFRRRVGTPAEPAKEAHLLRMPARAVHQGDATTHEQACGDPC
ncbi:hypothetical protein ACFWAP_04015 [Streptomyces goshikiensis]|uniref:hypothetical protein n=1 Tax=Streptomyces goshikiensis TaxID=1942 RepID=UPI00365C9C07